MTQVCKRAVKAIVASTPLPELVLRSKARRRLTVVSYHRIYPRLADFPLHNALISATPEEFTREVNYYNRHLDVISISELLAGLEQPSLLPQRPAVITFDDGYADNFEFAVPVLQGTSTSACFFISTDFIGDRTIPWFVQVAMCLNLSKCDRIASPFCNNDPPFCLDVKDRTDVIRRYLVRLKQLPSREIPRHIDYLIEATRVIPGDHVTKRLFMSWDDLRTLVSAGMEIGGHTRSHPVLSRVEEAETLRHEIAGCREDLRRGLGIEPRAFAYPTASSDDQMSEQADLEIRRAGFQVGFSYVHSFALRNPPNRFQIPRIHTEFGEDFREFRLGLARAPMSNRAANDQG